MKLLERVLKRINRVVTVDEMQFGVIIIIMVIFRRLFSREHVDLSLKNGVNIEFGKTKRLKALCMMQNNTSNKQTMCQ